MEIVQLHLKVTEQDFNDLARRHVPEEVAIEDLEIRIQPEGVRVKGRYQVFVPVSFEALWELGVADGKATARLANFKTMGMPGNVLKSLIMNVIADAAKKEPWLAIQGEVVQADLDALCKLQGLTAQTRLKSLRCEGDAIVVEAGLPQ